jgi:hypothetical protein
VLPPLDGWAFVSQDYLWFGIFPEIHTFCTCMRMLK